MDGIDGNGVVWGWAADYSNPMIPISVHFYVDQLDQAHYAGRVDAYEKYNRPDVWQYFNWGAANHGYAFTIPNTSPNDPSVSFNLRNGASHQIYAFGIALNGTSTLLGSPATPVLANLPSSLTQPLSVDGKFSMVPNQLAGNLRYRPPPETWSVVNGHIEGSFDNFGYWPSLNSKLRQINGGFGIFAPEIGYMQGSTLQKFRNAGIPLNVEMPACGICLDGDALARAEFNGQAPYPNFWNDYFFENYYIGDRRHPSGVGWFRTRNDLPYTPDEVALDHRLDGLMQGFNISIIMDTSNPYGIQDPAAEWQNRKNRARVDPCPGAASFNPGVDRITGLVNDYVEYAKVMKAHFAPGPSPRFSFHWPSSPGMEWSNEAWLDQTFAANPNPAAFVHAIQYVLNPQHKDTDYLAQVVDALCASGTCPDTVYMDTDFTYLSNYTIADLRRKKAMLEGRNVKMGIDLVDTCTDQDRAAALPSGQDCVTVLSGDGNWLSKQTRSLSQYSSNALYEESVLAVTNFLRIQGIIDANTKVRMESWYRRPIESGSGIHENNAGSFAHTANRVFSEYLQPGGWDRSWHQNGLAATFFDNNNFTGPSITRRDPRVNFDWGAGAPDPFIGPDDFSVRWEGQVWAGYSETYTFYTLSDDGVRLWVNNQLLIDNWSYHGPTENSASINLVRGQKYNIKLEYFEGGGGATMKLSWSSPSQTKQIIPEDRLFSGTGLRGTYFDHIDFTGASLTRTDPTVNFDWGVGSPALSIPVDNFSARWEGQVSPGSSETYTFYTVSDDGVRLWVNNQLLIDNWGDHGPTENSGTIALQSGYNYNIKAEFYEHGGGATMKLLWSSPSQAKTVIPQTLLYPPP